MYIKPIVDSDEHEKEAHMDADTILHRDRTILKEVFLQELIQNHGSDQARISEKLKRYRIPLKCADTAKCIILKFEKHRTEACNPEDIKLFYYGAVNIAEETYSRHFHIGSSQTSYGYAMILVQPKQSDRKDSASWSPKDTSRLTRLSGKVIKRVQTLLKGNISLYISEEFTFPEGLQDTFYSTVAGAMKTFEPNRLYAQSHIQDTENPGLRMGPLQAIYEPPTLFELMDIGNIEKIDEKLSMIFTELEQKWPLSKAHMDETYLHLISCFTYYAHKNEMVIEDILRKSKVNAATASFYHAGQLRAWAMKMFYTFIETESGKHAQSRHKQVIERIHEFIQANLNKDTSLSSISEAVFLHPVYISKIYKKMTGMNISDYILHIRMEKAVLLLASPDYKMKDIAQRVGYQSDQYFIRAFKKYYGMTPSNYRIQQCTK